MPSALLPDQDFIKANANSVGKMKTARNRGPFHMPVAGGSRSERVPGWVGRQLQVADVGTQPGADAGADRRQDDVVVGIEGHANTGNEGVGVVTDCGLRVRPAARR